MYNVLYILPYVSIGGTEKHVLDLITGFSEEYKLFLLAPPGEIIERFKNKNIVYYDFPQLDKKFFSGLRIFYKRLKEIQEKHNIDLIHIHGAAELIFLLKRSIKDIPVLFTVHGFHGNLKAWDYWLCARICNHYANMVITVAGSETQLLLHKKINPDLINTIYNGVPDPSGMTFEEPEKLKKISKDNVIIGSIARLETTKGINYLIDSFALALQEKDDIHLVIVGTGSKESELKTQVNKLCLNHKISFTGYRSDIHNFLNKFDIMVIPSLHEAHPLVLMEAMGHAKPIIATAVGGIPEVINDNQNGLLIPPANSDKLKSALCYMLENKEIQDKLGKNARKSYEEKFTVEKMLKNTRKVYDSLLSNEQDNQKIH